MVTTPKQQFIKFLKQNNVYEQYIKEKKKEIKYALKINSFQKLNPKNT